MFLQWFALTGNLDFAAEQADIARQTVSKHRLSDLEFAAAYDQAIDLGVPDLKARLFAHVKGRPKLDVNGELEPPDEKGFDPELALRILREQQRIMAMSERGPGRPLKRGRAPRVATNAEVRAALVKALKAYGVRIEGGRDAGDGKDKRG